MAAEIDNNAEILQREIEESNAVDARVREGIMSHFNEAGITIV